MERRRRLFLGLGMGLAALATAAALLVRWWRRRAGAGVPALPEFPPGLTEEEAAARWLEGQDNTVHLKPPRTRQEIWRENLYTIFNLSLVGLAFTQALLGQWLNAVLSLGTIFLNVGINVAQEMLAMRRLAVFQRSARPRATVVREGKTRSIEPNRVVPGDVLIAGPGDQFLVDGQAVGTGQMEVDASVVTGRQGRKTVRPGDPVYAGSFCVSGRGAYVAQRVGDERLIVRRMAELPTVAAELTPLEHVVDRVLRVLLVLVAIFGALLLSAYFRLDLGVPADVFNDAASVIFNIAPSGLFLMIVVTYATGTADLAKLGALVHRARSVESLAEATVICFAEGGILTGTRIEIEPIHSKDGGSGQLPESRVRQVLGDYARSTSSPNLVTRALIESFEGSRRAVRAEAPFLAALGWSAITFDDRDLRGVYVLGEPPILDGHLTPTGEGLKAEESLLPTAAVRRVVSPLGRLFRRRKGEPDTEAGEEPSPEVVAEPTVPAERDTPAAEAPDSTEASDGDQEGPRFFRRMTRRVGGALRGLRRAPEPEETSKPAAESGAVLLFAYCPEPVPLVTADGSVQLPGGLIPLSKLSYSRELRPEAVDIVKEFIDTGVSIKVFSSGQPDQLLALFQKAGLVKEGEDRMAAAGMVSGQDLAQLPRRDWARAAAQNAIFGQVTPTQVGALVGTLRERGELVAVVGDGVADLPALQQADLAIVRQTSTQAALGVADIVMMGSSPGALLKVLHKGQAIVHGLLDVLKLNLTQVFYLAMLIAGIRFVSAGFPYTSAQGTAIAVITVALPSVGLSLWARSGVVPSARFGRTLARFVGPAAVMTSLAALIIYRRFLEQSGRVAYAQLALTYTLIYTGLLLAVFAKPPWRSRTAGARSAEGEARRWDWRLVVLVLILGVTAYFLPGIPLAQQYLGLDWLQKPADYGIIVLAIALWAMALNLIWWVLPPVDVPVPEPAQGYAAEPSYV